MEIRYTYEAEADIIYWKKSGNIAIQRKITKLLEAILVSPTTGIGKPEQLKHQLSGCWSRRINDEHRIVYKIFDDRIDIISLRLHY
jgi:toxin YoeB